MGNAPIVKLLLDTHIWLWSLLEPEKLSRRVARELDSPANELWLSPISVWETLVLCQKGRLVVGDDPSAWIAKAIRAAPLIEPPLTTEVALETSAIKLPHGDPADRFLVATAKVFGLTLVTADQRLIRARQAPVLANR
jgi:PIN domain nuclease of toxin-antitoxin system